MSKHTPGPWKVCGDNMAIKAMKDGYDPHPKTIVICVEHHNLSVNSPIACDEGYANARLIAAAPELLSIVKDILPDDHSDYSDGERCDECGTRRESSDQTECDVPGCWYVRVREAIRKAEGRD